MDESGDALDESNLMIVEEFKRIMEFYNQVQKVRVCDYDCFMDLFRFFIGRDMMFEATLLAEKMLIGMKKKKIMPLSMKETTTQKSLMGWWEMKSMCKL